MIESSDSLLHLLLRNSCEGEIRPVLLLNLPCLCKCLPTFHSSPNVAYSHSIRLNHLSLNRVKLLVIPFVYIHNVSIALFSSLFSHLMNKVTQLKAKQKRERERTLHCIETTTAAAVVEAEASYYANDSSL